MVRYMWSIQYAFQTFIWIQNLPNQGVSTVQIKNYEYAKRKEGIRCLRIWTDSAKSFHEVTVHTYLGSVGAGSSVSHGKDSPALVLQSKVLIREILSVDGLAYNNQIQNSIRWTITKTGQIPNYVPRKASKGKRTRKQAPTSGTIVVFDAFRGT
jgi:hypothetical protein